jgi:pimeloyl-ACP methyl ester carboxylesterase
LSSGAVLAIEAAARGLPITKLALWEPPFTLVESARQASEDYRVQLTELLSAGRRSDAAALFMQFVGLPAEFVAEARNAPWWQKQEDLAPTLAYDATIMGDSSVPTGRLASVMVPTLVMDGGASPTWMGQAAEAVVEALPHGQRRTLEGQTHNVVPEAIVPVLVAFFKG